MIRIMITDLAINMVYTDTFDRDKLKYNPMYRMSFNWKLLDLEKQLFTNLKAEVKEERKK